MFNILRNPEANVKNLTVAYSQAMTFEEKLRSEQTEAKHNLVSSQLDCLEKKPTKDFLNAKDRLDNISSKIEAVQFGREELKTRIGERLQVESQERLEVIGKELDAVAAEEKTLKMQYLDLCGKAALAREQIRGAETFYNGSVLVRLTPDPKFNFQLLDSEEQKYYTAKVEEVRRELSSESFSKTIEGQRSSLVGERDRLEGMLESDPQEEAERLLDKYLPPVPEPAEVIEPPKTHPAYESKAFIRDYSEGVGPDYDAKQGRPVKM